MHRFFLPADQCHPPNLSLTGSEAHHALHVLRLRKGERVTVLDGAGTIYTCEITGSARDLVDLTVAEQTSTPSLPWQVTLIQALPKGKLIESIIQKATELGVVRIVPLLTERVVVHLDTQAAAEKQQKWQAVAVEAIKQCGSAWLPRVETPVTLTEFIRRSPGFELSLVGSLQPDSRHPRDYFREFEQQHSRRPISVCAWIGPEGDFTAKELELIESTGARPITLGRLVLRTETAAIYCASIFNFELSAPGN